MNCQICFENYNDSKAKPYSITPCGHTFCSKCLDNLMVTDSAKCPKCRVQIKGKIMNFAILDVLDLNLIPDSNVNLKKTIEKTINDMHGLETQFFAAYEQKVQENKERIKLLKEEINNQTIELINQIKQNRVNLFKNSEQLEITMNESLLRYLHTEQQIELNVSERTSQLKNLNQYERSELNSFKEQLDKSKQDFDSNIKEMKHLNFKLEFKKYSNNPNINFIGDIIHETPVTKDIKPEIIEPPAKTIAPIVSIEPIAATNPSKLEINSRFSASSRASGTSKSALERKRVASAPRASLNNQIKPPLSLLATIKGTSRVKALCSLPNGYIASGSRDNIIKIWNPKDSTLLTTLKGHTNSINCLLTLSNDYIASGSTDTTIMIWNTQTGVLSKTLTGHSGFVHALALLFSGNIASGSDDCTVKIWDTVTGAAVKTFKGHTYTVLSLCVLRNGNLASGSADTNIKIWNTENSSARSLRTLTGHTNSVNCLCLVGDYLASGSNDRTIKMWNTSNGDLLSTLVGHKDYVSALCSVSHDLLASGSLDNTLKVWNIKNGQLAKNLIDHCDWITSLVMVHHKYLASGSHDETIKIWSL